MPKPFAPTPEQARDRIEALAHQYAESRELVADIMRNGLTPPRPSGVAFTVAR